MTVHLNQTIINYIEFDCNEMTIHCYELQLIAIMIAIGSKWLGGEVEWGPVDSHVLRT